MFRYLKELIKDIYSAFKYGFTSMRMAFMTNRSLWKAEIAHEKLVEIHGHCGAFLSELEEVLPFISEEKVTILVTEFVKWTKDISKDPSFYNEDVSNLLPREEKQWEDILDYCNKLNITVE